MRIMKIMKILKLLERIMKIMKTQEFHMIKIKNIEILKNHLKKKNEIIEFLPIITEINTC